MLETILKITIGIGVLLYVFSVVPAVPLPTPVATAITWLIQVLKNFDFIVSAGTILTILSYIFFVEITIFTIKAIKWIRNIVISAK